MFRSRAPRITRLLIAALVGFAPPTLALAHGYAHHEAHEAEGHDRHRNRGKGTSPSDGSNGGLTTELRAGDDAEDHGHPHLSGAISVRSSIPLFVVMAPATALPIDIAHVGTASLLLTAAPARAGPPGARPRQPRAPPIS